MRTRSAARGGTDAARRGASPDAPAARLVRRGNRRTHGRARGTTCDDPSGRARRGRGVETLQGAFSGRFNHFNFSISTTRVLNRMFPRFTSDFLLFADFQVVDASGKHGAVPRGANGPATWNPGLFRTHGRPGSAQRANAPPKVALVTPWGEGSDGFPQATPEKKPTFRFFSD